MPPVPRRTGRAGRARTASWGDLGRLLVAWGVGTVALAVAGDVLPGLSADGWRSWAYAAAVLGVVGAVLRPVLSLLAAVVGWVGVVLLALVGQAAVLHVALAVVPGVSYDSWATLLAAAWLVAAFVTGLEWLLTAGTPDSFVAALEREVRPRRRAEPLPDADVTGMLFVQLDGVPYPLLRWALQAGLMPTVRRWVDDGSHVAREWQVQLPCTTPASQLGILHGTSSGVPAFRWHDRELGRVLVANRPADARIIEARGSDGRGLLADDGTSVSNLFSGDAGRSSMVMSRIEPGRGALATRRALAAFVARPDGLARTVSRALAEVVRERHQARRQVRRDVVPRIHRPWVFTGLRAVTNGLLRDLNLLVVARELGAGRRSVYVDFVDYDEVAHHAGPTRLESLGVLVDLDQVVAVLERLVAVAPRDYEIVLLSDHGQSTGTPFADAHGEGLDAVCRRLMDDDVAWVGEPVEGWGRAGSIAEDVSSHDPDDADDTGRTSLLGRVARRYRARQQVDAGPDGASPGPVVLGSGNLGLVYAGGDERLTLEDLDERWPRLRAGLAEHPGVGMVAGVSATDGPVVHGAGGSRVLATGEVRGDDPLAGWPAHAGAVLAEALSDPTAPDLYVNSAVDPSTDEVLAFEDLVGCHGGLGGWQDRGTVVAPTRLWRAEDTVVGAAALHRELVAMLEALGHRRDLPDRSDLAAPVVEGAGG